MRKIVFLGIISVILSAAILLLSAPNAEAKKKPRRKSKPKTEKVFYFDLGLDISYDDNVINYSDADLDLFGSDSLSGKFAIESKDDWILIPRIHPGLKTKFIGGQEAIFEAGFDYYGFVQDDVKRYSRLSISGRQYISKKLYGELSYYFIPDYYYRNYTTIPGDTSSYKEAKFSKHSVALEAGYEIVRNLNGRVKYTYQHKSFNKDFNFRNTNLNGIDIEGIYRLKWPFRVWAIYGYEDSKADGADMAETFIDASYHAWDITFGARYFSSLLPKYKPEIFASLQNRFIKYQTDRLNDIYRVGRDDHNILARLGTTWRLPYRIGMTAEYVFSKKDASLPNIYTNTSALEDLLNYTSNSITMRFSRQF